METTKATLVPLEKVVIRYFQNHDKRVVKFDARGTSLVGPTESGKSAVLRAVKWVCLNEPGGKSFVGRWRKAPFASVKLYVDGHCVERRRGDGVNLYKLDGKVFKAFGRGVPEPVKQVLNVGDLNFQGQHDRAFLLSLGPADCARRLNKVVNLGAIDKALAAAAKIVRSAKAETEITKRRLAGARESRDELTWTESADALLRTIERLRKRRAETAEKRERLRMALESLRIARRRKGALGAACDAAERLRAVYSRLKAIRQRRTALQTLCSRLRRAQRLLKAPRPAADRLKRLVASRAALRERRRGLQSLITGLENMRYLKCEAEKNLQKAKQELKGRCPTCGQSLLSSAVQTSTSHSTHPPAAARRERNGSTPKRDISSKWMTLQEALACRL